MLWGTQECTPSVTWCIAHLSLLRCSLTQSSFSKTKTSCSRLSHWYQGLMFLRTNLINKKKKTEDDIQYLILPACEQVPSSIQQQACIFFGILFAANISAEVLVFPLTSLATFNSLWTSAFQTYPCPHKLWFYTPSGSPVLYSLYPHFFHINLATSFLLIPAGLLLLLCEHLHIKMDYSWAQRRWCF